MLSRKASQIPELAITFTSVLTTRIYMKLYFTPYMIPLSSSSDTVLEAAGMMQCEPVRQYHVTSASEASFQRCQSSWVETPRLKQQNR